MAKAADALTGLKEGAKAPEIKLKTADGRDFQLSALKGKRVVLYFYPKADTPGCTKQACAFRDSMSELEGLNAEVVGVSPDAEKAIGKFRDKYNLSFTLLADVDHKAAEAYGVWKEKSMYGKTYMGVERTTFVIDENGKIAKIFQKVKVDGHADEVQAALAG